MALEEPVNIDGMTEVDDIRIVYDYTVQKHAKALSVICRDTVYGKKLVVNKLM